VRVSLIVFCLTCPHTISVLCVCVCFVCLPTSQTNSRDALHTRTVAPLGFLFHPSGIDFRILLLVLFPNFVANLKINTSFISFCQIYIGLLTDSYSQAKMYTVKTSDTTATGLQSKASYYPLDLSNIAITDYTVHTLLIYFLPTCILGFPPACVLNCSPRQPITTEFTRSTWYKKRTVTVMESSSSTAMLWVYV